MTDKTILTRRDLYELVWSTPLVKLAEQFGVSDRGLAKICERHRVPSPPRGYWAKYEAGANPKRAIFVEATEPSLNIVEINPTLSNIPDEARDIIEKARAQRKENKRQKPRAAQPLTPALAPVGQVHVILAATAKALRKPQTTEIVTVGGASVVPLRLGVGSVERVIALLDVLVRRLADKGFTVGVTDKGLEASVGPEKVIFGLQERFKREPHEPTQEELAAEKRRQAKLERARLLNSWSYELSQRAYPETDEVPQGELILQVEGYSDGVRRRWADGSRQRLEGLLDGIVTGFEVLAATRKAERLKWEQRRRDDAELARRQSLAEERRKREKKRKALLAELMSKSAEANFMRQWLAGATKGDEVQDSEFEKFIAWARAKLSALDHATAAAHVARLVREQSLFPDSDPLHDPLGEPPRRYYYGMATDNDD